MRKTINRLIKNSDIKEYKGYKYRHSTDLFGNKIVLVFGVGEFNTMHDMVAYINDLMEQKEDIFKILH